jgi:hypothetical protein
MLLDSNLCNLSPFSRKIGKYVHHIPLDLQSGAKGYNKYIFQSEAEEIRFILF